MIALSDLLALPHRRDRLSRPVTCERLDSRPKSIIFTFSQCFKTSPHNVSIHSLVLPIDSSDTNGDGLMDGNINAS